MLVSHEENETSHVLFFFFPLTGNMFSLENVDSFCEALKTNTTLTALYEDAD